MNSPTFRAGAFFTGDYNLFFHIDINVNGSINTYVFWIGYVALTIDEL